jgi:predicted transcriptional regulator
MPEPIVPFEELAPIERSKISLKVFELFKAGYTPRQIAMYVGYSEQQTRELLAEEQAAIVKDFIEDQDKARRLDLNRLDDMLRAVYSNAVKGNLNAVDRVLKILERRAKYLGTDQHVDKFQMGGKVTLEQLVLSSMKEGDNGAEEKPDASQAP